jgi:hypothetical protein
MPHPHKHRYEVRRHGEWTATRWLCHGCAETERAQMAEADDRHAWELVQRERVTGGECGECRTPTAELACPCEGCGEPVTGAQAREFWGAYWHPFCAHAAIDAELRSGTSTPKTIETIQAFLSESEGERP